MAGTGARLSKPSGNIGPWRQLAPGRNPEDPKRVLCTVSLASDVRPAVLDAAGRYQDCAEVR